MKNTHTSNKPNFVQDKNNMATRPISAILLVLVAISFLLLAQLSTSHAARCRARCRKPRQYDLIDISDHDDHHPMSTMYLLHGTRIYPSSRAPSGYGSPHYHDSGMNTDYANNGGPNHNSNNNGGGSSDSIQDPWLARFFGGGWDSDGSDDVSRGIRRRLGTDPRGIQNNNIGLTTIGRRPF